MCCTWWGQFISCFGSVLDMAEVNTGCFPLGVLRGSRVIQNGRWAFLPVHTWSLPSHAEPLGLPLFSGPSSPLPSMQQSNEVGNIRVTVANTGLMGIKQAPSPLYLLSGQVNGRLLKDNRQGVSKHQWFYCCLSCSWNSIIFQCLLLVIVLQKL